MKAMELAHKLTKAHTLGSKVSAYRDTFAKFLSHSHKVEKQVAKRDTKYLIQYSVAGNPVIVDLRDLPVFSASRDVIGFGVETWSIRGNVKGAIGWNKEAQGGLYLHNLNEALNQYVMFADDYKEICLLLEFNGNLYRLIK